MAAVGNGTKKQLETMPHDETDTPRPWRAVFGLQETEPVGLTKVEKLYRRLARERHPDRGGSNEMMQELNRAREEGPRRPGPRRPGCENSGCGNSGRGGPGCGNSGRGGPGCGNSGCKGSGCGGSGALAPLHSQACTQQAILEAKQPRYIQENSRLLGTTLAGMGAIISALAASWLAAWLAGGRTPVYLFG
jgi:hypothetical protein